MNRHRAAGDFIRNHIIRLKTGIQRSPEFAKKGLAAFAANVGLKCGHDCTYCSTGAMVRLHRAFKQTSENPFEAGYTMLDPSAVDRIARDARKMQNRGLVQVCTTTDAWAPEAQEHNMGRRILEAILSQPGWTVRILTKNAAVMKDFDLIEQHRDRVVVGISVTAGLKYSAQTATIEPYASPISERVRALQEAHRLGLRTYAMLCPIMPYALDSVDELVDLAVGYGAEEFFAEGVNPRGRGLVHTETALRLAGYDSEAQAVRELRTRTKWSVYAMLLLRALQTALDRHGRTDDLRYMLYPSSHDYDSLQVARAMPDQRGIVWLGQDDPETDRMSSRNRWERVVDNCRDASTGNARKGRK